MLVEELNKNRFKRIDTRFYDSLPRYCEIESCGFPIEINEVLNDVRCTNKRCPKKIARRIELMSEAMGIDINYEESLQYVLMNNVTNPMYLFKSQAGIELTEEDKNKLKEELSLRRYVELNKLPFLEYSLIMFDDYTNLDDFYKELDIDGVEYIEKQLGLYTEDEDEISLRAIKIYEVLMTFKQDLYEGIEYVTLEGE